MPPIIENLSRASLNSHPGNVSAAGSSRSTRRSRRSEQDSEVAFVGVLQEAPIVISDNEEELNDSLEDQLPDEMVLEMSENSIDLSKLDSDIEVASHSQDSAVVEQVRENDTPISLENVETTLNLPAESTHNMTTRSRSRSSNRSISNSNSSINMNNLSILPEMTELDATVDLVEADSTQNSRPQSQNSHILYLSSDSEDEDIVDREGLFANFRNNLRRLVRRETN